MELYLGAALLWIFLGISAFFAASEVAFLSMSSIRLGSLVEKNVPGAKAVARLREKRRRVVISILIGNNIANIAASALATSIAIALFGEAGIGVAVGIMSFLLLTFGDITPKSFATSYGEKTILAIAPVLEGFYYVSFPFVILFEQINKIIPGVYSRATTVERFTEDDVRTAVKLGAKHKGITDKEKQLIENVLAFNDRTVEQAMTPKPGVVCLHSSMTVMDAQRKAVESKYSRFPVLSKKGNVTGLVSIKTINRALYENPDWAVGKIAIGPVKLHAREKANAAFSKLQKMGRNIAIVVNDKGDFTGIVTLEDLLEELVGEIE